MNFSNPPFHISPADDKRVTVARRASGVAAWRHIADSLAEDIAGGIVQPGGQLPVEADLAARFGVNRHTLRRAIAELAARGLVRTTQGRGTFVEQRPLAYPIGSRTRFSENVSRAGREAGATLLASAEARAEGRVAAGLRIAEEAPVLRLDTLRLADQAPIAMGHAYFPLPRFVGLDTAFRDLGTLTAALSACGVKDYRRAETHFSARLATTEEAARLDLAPNRPVLVVDSINLDEEGVPIDVTFAVFAADRCELVVTP